MVSQDLKQATNVTHDFSEDTKQSPYVRNTNASTFGQGSPPRTLSNLDILSAGFNICNSWCGVAATMFLGFISGGPVTIIYGTIVSFFAVGCCTLSLAELAAVYPTAGGQHHWTWIMAPPRYRRPASYVAAIANMFAWLSITASVCVGTPQLIAGMTTYWHPSYIPQKWHSFLIYQVSNILMLGYNLFILRRAAVTHTIGMFFSLGCFFTFLVACVATPGSRAQSHAVWQDFINEGSGWPNGVVFMIGLVNPHFMYIGIDGAVHLAEDARNASSAVPKALIATLLIGFVTTLPFVVAMFYCISDIDEVLKSTAPIFIIWKQATNSGGGATVMGILLLITGYFAINATQQTASRLTWSFARDNGLVFAKQMSKVDSNLEVPVEALLFNATIVFIMGCIYLGSQTAFNSLVGTCIIVMQLTLSIPIFFVMLSGRDPRLIGGSKWYMGNWGWVANAISIVFTIVTSIFYCFPVAIPVTGASMNYAIAVLATFALFGALNWFGYASKHYKGPAIDFVRS